MITKCPGFENSNNPLSSLYSFHFYEIFPVTVPTLCKLWSSTAVGPYGCNIEQPSMSDYTCTAEFGRSSKKKEAALAEICSQSRLLMLLMHLLLQTAESKFPFKDGLKTSSIQPTLGKWKRSLIQRGTGLSNANAWLVPNSLFLPLRSAQVSDGMRLSKCLKARNPEIFGLPFSSAVSSSSQEDCNLALSIVYT